MEGIEPHHDGDGPGGEQIDIGGCWPTASGDELNGSGRWTKTPGIKRLRLESGLGFMCSLPPSETKTGNNLRVEDPVTSLEQGLLYINT